MSFGHRTWGASARSHGRLLRTTWWEFGHDGGSRLSAAMAYYVLFLLAPAVLLMTSLTTRVIGTGGLEPVLVRVTRDMLARVSWLASPRATDGRGIFPLSGR
jgi:hypothetical protein